MDLKTFAVSQKLVYDNALLKYVIKKEPVPCDVLEASLQPLIGDMQDPQAEHLINDYKQLLCETVPVVYKHDVETDSYNLSGEIPDTILEAIQMVHNVVPEDAVKTMIEENMRRLSKQDAVVHSLNLKAQVEKILAEQPVMPAVKSVREPEAVVEKAITEQVMEQPKVVIEPVTEQEQPEIPTIAVEQTIHDELNVMEQTIHENGSVVTNEHTTEIEMPELVDEPFTDVVEATTETETEEDEEKHLRDAIRRIYKRLVEDIKERNLDVALNIAV